MNEDDLQPLALDSKFQAGQTVVVNDPDSDIYGKEVRILSLHRRVTKQRKRGHLVRFDDGNRRNNYIIEERFLKEKEPDVVTYEAEVEVDDDNDEDEEGEI